MNILVFGLGGVGGYYGGQLARYYAKDPRINIHFVARGSHLRAIRERGLRVKTDAGEWTAHPAAISDDPRELPGPDLVVLAVKTYDLEAAADQIRPIVRPDTWVLPLMNGVDNTERLQAMLPTAKVLEGLVYVVAFREEPGLILQKGVYDQIEFGSEVHSYDQGLDRIEGLFHQASVHADYAPNIREKIWEKYMLISAVGSVTSFSGLTIGEMRDAEVSRRQLEGMLQEVYALAIAKGIHLPQGLIGESLAKVERFDPDATSSMQRDFAAGRRTEAGALTGYVVEESRKFGLKAPVANALFAYLSEKSI